MDIYFYFIELENNKYYVATWLTNNMTIDDIYKQDTLNTCIDWLLIHKPVQIKERHMYNGGFSLDDHVLIYMSKYGRDNVRGGSYIDVNLSKHQREQIALSNICTDDNNILIIEEIKEERISCCTRIKSLFCRKDKYYRKPLLNDTKD